MLESPPSREVMNCDWKIRADRRIAFVSTPPASSVGLRRFPLLTDVA